MTALALVDNEIAIEPSTLALRDVPLEQLATEITTEHEAATYNLRESVVHARRVGVLLLEVKRRLKHGEFMPWVQTHCVFSQSTANVYMRVAKCWNTVANSQPVPNLTLREANALLSIDPNDEYAEAEGELVGLGCLAWSDLEGLDVSERRTLVAEVKAFYRESCYEPDEALQAEREAGAWWTGLGRGGWSIDRGGVHCCAARVATALRSGKIGRGQIRRRLREGAPATTAPSQEVSNDTTGQPSADAAGATLDTSGKRAPICRVTHVSPFAAYVERTNHFIAATRALLTHGHGLLDERVTLDEPQRAELLALIERTRRALSTLEQQAAS